MTPVPPRETATAPDGSGSFVGGPPAGVGVMTPAGWYVDPFREGKWRWWDGRSWTDGLRWDAAGDEFFVEEEL